MIGKKFRDAEGKVFTVQTIANRAAKDTDRFPPTVVFADEHGYDWSLHMADFVQNFQAVQS